MAALSSFKLESPFPPIAEATDAFAKIISIQKDLLILNAELKAWREFKRVMYGIGAILTLNLTLVLTFYWITIVLYQNGLPAWLLALLSFALFGFSTAILGLRAIRLGRKREQENDLTRQRS